MFNFRKISQELDLSDENLKMADNYVNEFANKMNPETFQNFLSECGVENSLKNPEDSAKFLKMIGYKVLGTRILEVAEDKINPDVQGPLKILGRQLLMERFMELQPEVDLLVDLDKYSKSRLINKASDKYKPLAKYFLKVIRVTEDAY